MANNLQAAGEAGRALIAAHLIEGGPGDPETLEMAATLCALGPDMVAALQMFLQDAQDSRLSGPGWDSLRATVIKAASILARIDGAPVSGVWRIVADHSAPDTVGALYWSNSDGWGSLAAADGFTETERATMNLPVGGCWWFDVDEGDGA